MGTQQTQIDPNQPYFEVGHTDSYIYMNYLRTPRPNDIDASTDQILKLRKELGINKMLADITKMSKFAGLDVQLAGMRSLWNLRIFKKFAFVVTDPELEHLALDTMSRMGLLDRFHPFSDKQKAIAWLESDKKDNENK